MKTISPITINLEITMTLKKADYDLPTNERLGIWCQNQAGSSWICKKIDAATVVMALLGQTEHYSSLPLSGIEERFLSPIGERQIIIYYEGLKPSAVVSWAYLSEEDGKHYLGNDSAIPPNWSSGKELWFVDFIHTYGKQTPDWILEHLKEKAFSDVNCYHAKRQLFGKDFNFDRQVNLNKDNKVEPLPSTNKIKKLKADCSYLDHLHPFRDFTTALSSRQNFELLLLEKYPVSEGSRVLVCGAEAYNFAICIAKKSNCEVVLYDKRAGWLTNIAERAAHGPNKLEAPQFVIKHGAIEQIPYGDGSFDFIFSFGSISRSTTPERSIQEVMRVLKKEGVSVLSELTSENNCVDPRALQDNGISEVMPLEHWQNTLSPFASKIFVDTPSDKEHWATSLLRWFHHPKDRVEQAETLVESSKLINSHIFQITRNSFIPTSVKVNRDERPRTSLVTFSGGIDSTYVLWKLLSETDDEVIALHINLKNAEGRTLIEEIRAEQIIRYLSEKYRPIKYETTTIDHRGMYWFGYDVMTVGFEVGIVATSHLMSTNRPVDRWTTASCLEEGHWESRSKHIRACVSASCYPQEAPPFFELPVIPKAEQMQEMPRELLEMTWYCRRPKITRHGYSNCNNCNTCLTVAGITAKHEELKCGSSVGAS